MSRVRVKICGITSRKDLQIAVEAGTDAVGMVVDVPQSPRNISINEAKELMKATPAFINTVAVIVPKDLNHLEKIYRELNPNLIQVHGLGHLHKEIRERLPNARLIGAIQIKPDFTIKSVKEKTEIFDAILLDSYVPGKHGGSGVTHDWEISIQVKKALHPKPLILAGGLDPKNIKETIKLIKPYAVDVSSGVEASPGVKDRAKVFEFIKHAKDVEI